MARAYNREPGAIEDSGIAAHPENGGRVVDFEQRGEISLIFRREKRGRLPGAVRMPVDSSSGSDAVKRRSAAPSSA